VHGATPHYRLERVGRFHSPDTETGGVIINDFAAKG
jgi:hypothetical protein